MAILNGLYVHVTDESASREVDATSHPVESGIPITDTVKPKALTISLSGKIVDYGGTKAQQVIDKIKSWQDSGSLITYRGRNNASNMQVRSFNTDHPNTNSGGADFSLELEQVRIAKSAYAPKKASSGSTFSAASIKVGSKVIFKGGPVYVASDAKKAAATRGRSTCKVTIINTRSWGVHDYHLISTDGGRVYGWVDFKNIEGCAQTGTSGTTNAGTQQVSSGSGSAVYHTVKKGDTVWALVNKKYKYLGKSESWVINNNPKAFSRKGDARTLQIGRKLLMGYKK